jgi:hypothetical protein
MFVQIIEGRVKDQAGLRAQMDRWMTDLCPGADGFLGTTAGVTSDGRSVAFARFESAAAASANSDRPEQGEWWATTEQCYDGPVAFTESEDVQEFLGGGSDDAGFVQVMKSDHVDRDQMASMDAAFAPVAATFRPDLIGSVRVWTGPNSGFDINYFTSEAEARAAEAKPPPAELTEAMASMQELIAHTEFFDLSEPWLF